ncbi:MAG: hypothetical protein JWR26_2777 [Pedosphaera sp.]|nr:hypothetical protein [Pedosphaera sp.]
MKIKNALVLLATASAVTMVAHADVQLTIVGSTAFRTVVKDRLALLFDAGFTSNTANSTTLFYSGTMQGAIPSLGNTPVTIRTDFSGSISGMNDVANGVNQPCINLNGSVTNVLSDIAFGEAYPSSATPALATSAFSTNHIVGVVPFVIAVNNNLYNMGVTNITREQATLLMYDSGSSGGTAGVPASFLGATGAAATNTPYMIGRNSDSGTRISTEKVIGYTTAFENLWSTNGSGGYISLGDNGFSSGGSVASSIANGALSIGYLGLADFSTITNSAKALNFEGVAPTIANVASGAYPLWGYEHFYSRIGLSANQATVRDALISALTNTTYQSTNTAWNLNFVGLSQMSVSRLTDGGQISGNTF